MVGKVVGLWQCVGKEKGDGRTQIMNIFFLKKM